MLLFSVTVSNDFWGPVRVPAHTILAMIERRRDEQLRMWNFPQLFHNGYLRMDIGCKLGIVRGGDDNSI